MTSSVALYASWGDDELTPSRGVSCQYLLGLGDYELTPSRGVSCQYLLGLVHLIEKPR